MDALKTIYHSILQGHISVNNLPSSVAKISEKVVDCALAMNQKVCTVIVVVVWCSMVWYGMVCYDMV